MPTEMDPLAFDAAFGQAETMDHPIASERAFSALLTDNPLSDPQQATVLEARAKVRQDAGINKPGAVADLRRAMMLRPGVPANAGLEAQAAQLEEEIEEHRERLTGLQNQAEWLNDMIAIGSMDKAAQRYRVSKLTPNERQTYLLREAGHICETGSDDLVHDHSPIPAYIEGLVWCPLEPNT